MRKLTPSRKKKATQHKALKSPFKAIQKIIKKFGRVGKKPVPKARRSVSKQNLILKKKFSEPVALSNGIEVSTASFGDRRLPDYYAENKFVLLARDPWWLFGYWEVTPQRESEVVGEIARNGLSREKTVLRVYDITGGTADASPPFFDIDIHHLNSNWYIDVGIPDREWVAEIGIRTHCGRFFVLIRSNAIKTPPFGISDVLDEEWMMPDELYFKLLGIMTDFESAGDSLQIRSLIEKRIRQPLFSENVSKLSKAPAA